MGGEGQFYSGNVLIYALHSSHLHPNKNSVAQIFQAQINILQIQQDQRSIEELKHIIILPQVVER